MADIERHPKDRERAQGIYNQIMLCRYYDEADRKDEPQTYITEDRDTQILDAWQVHNRSTTSIEDEPQTDCAWK